MHQIPHERRFHVEQLYSTAHLLAQVPPIEIKEGMISGNFPNHLIRDTRPFTQPRQMQLLHFSAPANVVHQEVSLPLFPNERHSVLPSGPDILKQPVV